MEMLITKEMAISWLNKTTRQRNVNKTVVRRYASDMAAGRWVADAAPPILITPEEAVADGQHRLHALLLQADGYVLPSTVKTVAPEAFVVVDTGHPRSLADTLQMLGHEHTKELSAIFYQSVRWANPTLAAKETPRSVQVALIRNNPNMPKAAEVAAALHAVRPTGTRVPIGVIGTLWDIAEYAEGGNEVVSFVQLLHAGSYESDLLRRFADLVADARNPRTRLTISPHQMALLVARVYAGWLTDEAPQKLYARRGSLQLLPGFSTWADSVYRTET